MIVRNLGSFKTISYINKKIIIAEKCCFYQLQKYAQFSTRKKKRVYQMKTAEVRVDQLTLNMPQQRTDESQYFKMKPIIDELQWRDLRFDQLCALDPHIINAIQLDLKKNKFNVRDQLFMKPVNKPYESLNRYYKKIYSILKNKNDYYEEFLNQSEDVKIGYLNQMYVNDLKNDIQLQEVIGRFIKHISNPVKLDGIVQPTFIKHLLSLKRQLMLQGIHFQTNAQKLETIKKRQKIKQSASDKQQLPQIKILQILNYQYEFWQDIRQNRAKNGQEQDFIVETRQIANPNQSLVLVSSYPRILVKYIIRKKKNRFVLRNFTIKCDLLIQIDQKYKRKVKIEWKGPSDKKVQQTRRKRSHSSAKEQQFYNDQMQTDEEVDNGKVGYYVIDYQGIYNGNPTIKSVFSF